MTKYVIPSVETVGGGVSEFFAPGNPIGLSLMGSGIGQLAGGAAGGSSGQSLGGSLGGLAGLGGGMMGGAGGGGLSSLFGGGGGGGAGGGLSSLLGMFGGGGGGASGAGGGLASMLGTGDAADPISAMTSGQIGSGDYPGLANMLASSGGAPGMASAAGGMANPGSGGGLFNAMFGGGGAGGGPMSFQNIMQQYPNMDPLQAMQMSYLQKMMNPDPMQQFMSSMGPIGQQLLQGRQQQQLEAMSRQAPSANLNGGSMAVPASFGAGGAPVAAAPPGSMPAQYMQLLEMLTR